MKAFILTSLFIFSLGFVLHAQKCSLDESVDDFTNAKVVKTKSKKIYELFVPGMSVDQNIQIQFIKLGDSLFLKYGWWTRADQTVVNKVYIKLEDGTVFKREAPQQNRTYGKGAFNVSENTYPITKAELEAFSKSLITKIRMERQGAQSGHEIAAEDFEVKKKRADDIPEMATCLLKEL